VANTRVCPRHGVDELRYFLLLEGGLVDDGDYCSATVASRTRAELANQIGNLLSRSSSNTVAGKVTANNTILEAPHNLDLLLLQGQEEAQQARAILQTLQTLYGTADKHYSALEYRNAISPVCDNIRALNWLYDTHQPWKLAKSANAIDHQRLHQLLWLVFESLRISGWLLAPIMPTSMSSLLHYLGEGTTATAATTTTTTPPSSRFQVRVDSEGKVQRDAHFRFAASQAPILFPRRNNK
jgi:methionyl-tRNA synthetase